MLEWIKSERSSLIPKVDGQLLCSTIDPVLEGRRWAEKVTAISRDWESFIVLGLGGGYHISALAALLPDTEILVINDNVGLERELLSRRGPLPSNVTLLSGKKPRELTENVYFRSSLHCLYGVGRHVPSIRLNRDYFAKAEETLLGRKSHQLLEQVGGRPGLKAFLQTLDLFQDRQFAETEITILELHQAMQRRGRPVEREALPFLVLRELVK